MYKFCSNALHPEFTDLRGGFLEKKIRFAFLEEIIPKSGSLNLGVFQGFQLFRVVGSEIYIDY